MRDLNWNFKSENGKIIFTKFQRNITSTCNTDSFATLKSQPNWIDWVFIKLLFQLQLFKEFEQFLLPFGWYSDSSVNYFCFKNKLCIIFTYLWVTHNVNNDLSTGIIKFYWILDNIKQNEFIFVPICLNLKILCSTLINEDPNILSIYLRLERMNNWHDVLFNMLVWFDFELKLVLLDLHSFDLILIPQQHYLCTLINCR